MQERVIQIQVRIGPRLLRWALACSLLAFLAPDLNPENVTLTTTYPSPSGVYNQMMTTGDTYLATTSGGKVGIGTTTPTGMLEVNGTAKFDGLITFASGQTFPGGTGITGVTAGTDLTGGGTSGSVTLNLDTTKVPTLASSSNVFSGSVTAL